jgi:glutamate formiminotransferase
VHLECVINVSEGRDERTLGLLADACGPALLDRHSDPDHNRSVFTLAGPSGPLEEAARALAAAAVGALDLADHEGAHPRFGVVDVVPFVPLVLVPRTLRRRTGNVVPLVVSRRHLATTPGLVPAVAARDRFARWAGAELRLPCFLFGPLPPDGHRSLPEVRRTAWRTLPPDSGPARPHPRAGAAAVGARHFMVAYNVWIDGGDAALARSVASAVRGPAVRALGFELAGRFQVSCNLIDPLTIGPAQLYDQIAQLVRDGGAAPARAELVGLLPAVVLDAVPRPRWPELDLRPESTIEARLESCGIRLD